MHLTCFDTVFNWSLDLYHQIPKKALLTWRPGVSSEHFNISQLHGFREWLCEYLFVPNGNAVLVLGRHHSLADFYSGPFSHGGEAFEEFVVGSLSV